MRVKETMPKEIRDWVSCELDICEGEIIGTSWCRVALSWLLKPSKPSQDGKEPSIQRT